MKRSWQCLVLLGLVFTSSLFAHQRSESFSHWQWNDGLLELKFSVTEGEIQRIAARTGQLTRHAELVAYLEGQLGPSDTETECSDTRPLTIRRSGKAIVIADAAWRCEHAPRFLRIAAFMDLAAEHTHVATFESGSLRTQTLLNSSDSLWEIAQYADPDIAPGEQQSGGIKFTSGFASGFHHALSGYDHLAFLLALILVCRRLRPLVWAITGFTVGHTISLFLAVTGVVLPDTAFVEAAIGLTIAVVAAERLEPNHRHILFMTAGVVSVILLAGWLGHSRETSWLAPGLGLMTFCYLSANAKLKDSGWFRMTLTVLFGLIHGFGFASVFQFVDVPSGNLIAVVLGFNLGVEFAQILAVTITILMARWMMRTFGVKPFVPELMAAAVLALGTFWFVSRSFGA